jgi:hypothetical protein
MPAGEGIEGVRLQKRKGSVDTTGMKWQSEAEMSEELRRIASEMRQFREELRSYLPGEARRQRRPPSLPIETSGGRAGPAEKNPVR